MEKWEAETFVFNEWKGRGINVLKGTGTIVEELEEAQVFLRLYVGAHCYCLKRRQFGLVVVFGSFYYYGRRSNGLCTYTMDILLCCQPSLQGLWWKNLDGCREIRVLLYVDVGIAPPSSLAIEEYYR